ncbi:ParA family protein [Micrococcaceae sp. AOP34-BR2-30]
MTRTVCISNQKGGVGKTTTTYHMARAAHLDGLSTLVIDADPQGNLTSSLSKEPLAVDTPGLADVLSSQTNDTLDDVLVPALWDGVDLIPTTGETLPFVRNELTVSPVGAEFRMKKAIQQVKDRYDLILIDCPPSIDKLTINAMVASSDVLIVTHAARYSLDGISHLLDSVDMVREYNPELKLAGLVVNQWEKQRNASQSWRRELTEAAEGMGLQVFEPMIPKRTMIAETADDGEALDQRGGEDAHRFIQIYGRYITKLMEGA